MRPTSVRCLVAVLVLFSASLLQARDLSFEERVQAQNAIERVYYSHQTDASRPFEQAVPRFVLEAKVRTYLRQSAALERYWNSPITAEVLGREVERMASATRMPERLEEVFAALGNDSFLIQECFARPAVASRASRDLFSRDTTLGNEGYDAWLLRVGASLDDVSPRAVAQAISLPGPSGRAASSCPADDTWTGALVNGVPDGREGHVAVWTGSQMIVFGGPEHFGGGRYDPASDVWTPISTVNARSR